MNIAILGYGKMGKAIESICASKEHSIELKINSKNTHLLNTKNLSNIDVAIEFSTPHTAFDNIAFCLKNNVPVISGTTGWLEELPKIKKLCKETQGSFLHSSNFSIGMNIFFEISQKIASLLKNENYKIQISETHHKSKQDAPSGSAKRLANDLKNITNYSPIINSYRKENIIGEHIVDFDLLYENIQIKHNAKKRKIFASGALIAAEWIIGKKGYFSMKDVLNLTT